MRRVCVGTYVVVNQADDILHLLGVHYLIYKVHSPTKNQ